MLANWFNKTARVPGQSEPMLTMYETGQMPDDSLYQGLPHNVVNYKPEFGGNRRSGYPKGTSIEDLYEESDFEKMQQTLPSSHHLIDKDFPRGEGVNNDEFTDPIDKPPLGRSKNIDVGPPRPNNDFGYYNPFFMIKGRSKIRKFNF